MTLSDISRIPPIQRKMGWHKGATLLDKWLSGLPAIKPAVWAPDTTTITMAWALGFPRAREVYDQMVRDKIWTNDPAKKQIRKMLHGKGLLTGAAPRPFGNSLTGPVWAHDKDNIQERRVTNGLQVDDMTAALANFVFRMVVSGTVTRYGGPSSWYHIVEIFQVGVYIQDSFDFEDEQPLGFWSDTPELDFRVKDPTYPDSNFTPVNNRSMREWRKTNKRGGDFLVFSDMIKIREDPPFQFSIS